jgi:hypothetical protein
MPRRPVPNNSYRSKPQNQSRSACWQPRTVPLLAIICVCCAAGPIAVVSRGLTPASEDRRTSAAARATQHFLVTSRPSLLSLLVVNAADPGKLAAAQCVWNPNDATCQVNEGMRQQQPE